MRNAVEYSSRCIYRHLYVCVGCLCLVCWGGLHVRACVRACVCLTQRALACSHRLTLRSESLQGALSLPHYYYYYWYLPELTIQSMRFCDPRNTTTMSGRSKSARSTQNAGPEDPPAPALGPPGDGGVLSSPCPGRWSLFSARISKWSCTHARTPASPALYTIFASLAQSESTCKYLWCILRLSIFSRRQFPHDPPWFAIVRSNPRCVAQRQQYLS